MKKSTTIFAVALALTSAPALAAEKEKKEGAEGPVQGRDWKAIDKNNDNLISPEEMEAWLKANPGPLASPKK